MPRTYNSSRRALQAAQTRKDVVDAAMRLFRANGWAGTTLAAVADAAGVAVETIYNGFGSKKALLRAAYEASIVGDAEPIPLAERPEFQALGEGTLDERIARGVALVADIHERSAGIWQAVVSAASGDEEIEAWRLAGERGRRIDVGRGVERIVGEPIDEGVLTACWLLFGPDTYRSLVVDTGMTRPDYESFVGATLRTLVGR